ncbi:MAG: DUF4352 domain-containing protein [Cyanobacteria bacterium P01_F01_bin.42]
MSNSRRRSPGLYAVGVWGWGLVCLGGLMGCEAVERPAIAPPNSETLEAAVPKASDPKKIYVLGEAFAIQDEETDVVITFSDSRTHRGEEFLKPKENHYWYYLNATVVNRSANEFVISPDFYTLTDSKKETHRPSIRAHAIEGLTVLQGRIAPNSYRTAEIGFELPDGVNPKTLSFDISNDTACTDKILRSAYFCQPIVINVTDTRG